MLKLDFIYVFLNSYHTYHQFLKTFTCVLVCARMRAHTYGFVFFVVGVVGIFMHWIFMRNSSLFLWVLWYVLYKYAFFLNKYTYHFVVFKNGMHFYLFGVFVRRGFVFMAYHLCFLEMACIIFAYIFIFAGKIKASGLIPGGFSFVNKLWLMVWLCKPRR